jgi:hypothetical protein
VRFIDRHLEVYGVEPICAVLPIAPSTYCVQQQRHADPTRLPVRARGPAAPRDRASLADPPPGLRRKESLEAAPTGGACRGPV